MILRFKESRKSILWRNAIKRLMTYLENFGVSLIIKILKRKIEYSSYGTRAMMCLKSYRMTKFTLRDQEVKMVLWGIEVVIIGLLQRQPLIIKILVKSLISISMLSSQNKVRLEAHHRLASGQLKNIINYLSSCRPICNRK